mgnify:FL=1
MNEKEKFELSSKLKELSKFKARHTELVSVYIPSEYDIQKVISQLSEELSLARNIKSSSTKKNVMDALEKMIRGLKGIGKTPEKGLAAFAGNVSSRDGHSDVQFWSIEPPEKMQIRKYRCDQTFLLEPLNEYLEDNESYGLVLLDRREAQIAVLKGKSINTIYSETSAVPGKYKAGGQSAARFVRVRENLARAFYQKVADVVNSEFSDSAIQVKGIIIGGPGPSKEEFYNENFLNQEIKKKVITVVDIGYSGEQGINELLEKSKDILANEAIIKEKKLTERFFNILGKTPDLAAYGKNVEKAMELGAVDTLLICDFLEDSEIKRLGNLCENQGGDWTIIDSSTRDGNTLKGLGGTGAILRYKLTF